MEMGIKNFDPFFKNPNQNMLHLLLDSSFIMPNDNESNNDVNNNGHVK